MGRVVAEGVRDMTGVLRDLIEDAALLVPVLGFMEGIGGAASVTSQLHCENKVSAHSLETLVED